jgi:two-component system cell cycle response regulator
LVRTFRMQLDVDVLRALVETVPQGVAVCDARAADFPIVYTNSAMQQLSGYSAAETLGRSLGFLQGDDQAQELLARVRAALHAGTSSTAMLRSHRPDGSRFLNEMTLVPLRDAQGEISHFASFHRAVGESAANIRNDAQRPKGVEDDSADEVAAVPAAALLDTKDPMLSTQALLAFVRDDKLTGLLRRSYFEELFTRDWNLAQRDGRRITVLLFDLDGFKTYFDVFGRAGADQTFRRIARVIGGCFRRGSDLCGRFGEDQIIAVSAAMPAVDAKKFAETVLTRVRDLAIHHPRSTLSRYVTATAGGATCVPPRVAEPQLLIDEAVAALQQAKDAGRNRAIVLEAPLGELGAA